MSSDLEKYHDKIDAYLRGELPDNERLLFEESLENNPMLKKEYLIHLELFSQIDDSEWISESFVADLNQVEELADYFKSEEAQEFSQVVEKVKRNYIEKNRNSKNKIKWLIPILAAASILLFVVFQYNTKPSNSELYASYNIWDDLPSLTNRNSADQLSKGQLLFEEEKYNESFQLFTEYLSEQTKDHSPVLMYVGISALELGKYDEAISYFDQLINSDSIDRSMGYWFKALLFLKQEKIEKTKEILTIIISNKENYNYIKAKALLSELE